MSKNKNILLFDGICNLCGRLVNFIIKQDKNNKISFLSLQSKGGQLLLRMFYLPTDDFDSVVYIIGDRYFRKSTAILYIFRDLGGVWKLFFGLIIIPPFIRDFIYFIIAKTRYKIFGKNDSCIY